MDTFLIVTVIGSIFALSRGTLALTDSMVVLVAPMMTHWIVMELQSPEAGGLIPIVAGKILFRHVSFKQYLRMLETEYTY